MYKKKNAPIIIGMKNPFLDKVRFKKLVTDGRRVYETVKNKFEPKENGKFLAIEPDSGKVYLSKDGALAIIKARKNHPKKLFYLVRIGNETAEIMANSVLGRR